MWHESYSIPSNHNSDVYVDPFGDYIEERAPGQEVEENVQDEEQAPVEVDSSLEDEPIQQGHEAMTQKLLQAELEANRI